MENQRHQFSGVWLQKLDFGRAFLLFIIPTIFSYLLSSTHLLFLSQPFIAFVSSQTNMLLKCYEKVAYPCLSEGFSL